MLITEENESNLRELLELDSSIPKWYIQWMVDNWITRKFPFYASFISRKDFDDSNLDYKILDIGCEWGAGTELLSRRFPNAEIFGIDTCQNQLEFARTYHNNERIQYILADPLEYVHCSPVDFIFCINWLENIPAEKHLGFIIKSLDNLRKNHLNFTINALDSLTMRQSEYDSKLFISATKDPEFIGHWHYEHFRVLEYSLRRWIKFVQYIDRSKLKEKDPMQYTTFNPNYDFYAMCLTEGYNNNYD
jgi:hypothetical protein